MGGNIRCPGISMDEVAVMEKWMSKDIHSFFEDIKTIRYGYMDINGGLHFEGDSDFKDHSYVFSSPADVIRNRCGWCWDVANLIAAWCRANGLPHVSLFMEYQDKAFHQTHTQVFLEYEDLWYAAPDNSDPESFGTQGFQNLQDCRDAFVKRFVDYVTYVRREEYDEKYLLLNRFACDVPPGIDDEAYLNFARTAQ